MARPSRWMQFTQNFNAMNSTMNDAFKKYETGKASKSEDYFADEADDEGNKVKLTGNDLKFAKNNAIADIYDKYGDQEGAMKLRTGNEELQGLMRDNRIGKATEASRIQVEGQGAVDAQQAGIGASKAATSASEAASALSGYQLENLQQQRNRDDTLTSIFTGLGEQEFESDADETAYVLNKLQDSGLPPNMINQGVEAFKTFGSNKIAMESDRLTRAAGEAMQGGVSAFEKFYNTEISDGGTLDIVQEDGNTVAYVMTGEGENQTREVLYTGKGETGQMEVLNSLYQSVKSPGEILESAVQNLSYAQGQANLGKTDAETALLGSRKLSEMSEQEIDKMQSGYIGAKTEQIRAQIEEMGGIGLGKQQEIAMEGLAAMQRSAEFQALGRDPDGLAVQQILVDQYKQNMGLTGDGSMGGGSMGDRRPDNIPPGIWSLMDPEVKKTFPHRVK
jgi:hypothetical protein